VTIPPNFLIATSKLEYLLRPRAKDDKSKFLLRLGFSATQPALLETAIRQAVAAAEAQLDRTTRFGSFYAIRHPINGPDGKQTKLRLIVQQRLDGVWSFVTLYPDKE
jgi:hypothetical protein